MFCGKGSSAPRSPFGTRSARSSRRAWRQASRTPAISPVHFDDSWARPRNSSERAKLLDREERIDKPRIFLGSSGKQAKLLQALTRGLEEVARVDPWTTSFNPGTTTLERLVELAHEVDFAAFMFAQDDWTTPNTSTPSSPESGQASPRDNVIFEAGLFGGVLGMRRTFILHANGSKLPTDLLGLTSVRYGEEAMEAEIPVVCEKLKKAIENEGCLARI